MAVLVASEEVALGWAILNRHLFMNRQDLQLPTLFLLDAEGRVAKVYRDRVDIPLILQDAPRIEAPPDERLARALPFEGTFYSGPGRRDYVPYGRDLLDQGLEAQAVVAFEQAAQGSPSASTLYRLGSLLVKTGQTTKARAAYERALALQPDLAEAGNDLGTLLAEGGDLPGAIARFRAALAATPDYPDALNNLGYALLLTDQPAEARELYERALEIQPDFPEALNNLGLILGRQGEFDRSEPFFRKALEKRPGYGEAANNLALVLVARGQPEEAIRLLLGVLETNPASESTYITLARIYLAADREARGWPSSIASSSGTPPTRWRSRFRGSSDSAARSRDLVSAKTGRSRLPRAGQGGLVPAAGGPRLVGRKPRPQIARQPLVVGLDGDLQRLAGRLDGFGKPARLRVEAAEQVQDQGVPPARQPDGLLCMRDGLLRPARHGERQDEVGAGRGVLRPLLDGLQQVRNGLVHSSLFERARRPAPSAPP